MAYAHMQNSSIAPVVKSFPAVARSDAKILILGSMPSRESLDASQYYAHPRNLFWPIIGQLTGAIPTLPYEQRLFLLQKSNIAMWDVLKTCVRAGSLDNNITDEVPNDLASFLKNHPKIRKICFNGKKAEESFGTHFPELRANRTYRFLALPSTSPAHASLTYEQKLESWKTILY